MNKPYGPSAKGFTLIELVIAIAILAIIVGIAIPAYTSQVVKTNRAEGKSALMQAAQALERCYTRFSSYTDSQCGVHGQLAGAGILSENRHYLVSYAGTPGSTTFTLQSTPQSSQDSNQADRDKWCGTFTLTHTGRRDMECDDGECTWDATRCWN